VTSDVFEMDWIYALVFQDAERQWQAHIRQPDHYVVIREVPFAPEDRIDDALPRVWLLDSEGRRPITEDAANCQSRLGAQSSVPVVLIRHCTKS